jgi:hypothetical protein
MVSEVFIMLTFTLSLEAAAKRVAIFGVSL